MTTQRLVAFVLAFVGPWGAGHFHLGRRARGAAWLAFAMVALVVSLALLPRLGASLGWFAAVMLPLVAMFVVWVGSIGDLFFSKAQNTPPWWQTVLFFVAGLAVPVFASTLVRATVLESFVVPSRSMEPAVLEGDHLFADKRDRNPRYGDVVVLASPENAAQNFVKRVVARPGDVLEMKHGKPWINGWEVPSCSLGMVTLGDSSGALEIEFLGDASYLVFYDAASPTMTHAGPFETAPDGYLVLGDNRNASADSRTWHNGRDGNVHASDLRGRALFVWFRKNEIDNSRFGAPIAGIALPSSLVNLRVDVDRCLAARPNANPPPRSQR